jgi:hypothetical protein
MLRRGQAGFGESVKVKEILKVDDGTRVARWEAVRDEDDVGAGAIGDSSKIYTNVM